jgi:anti-anti-sigma regulatory factor
METGDLNQGLADSQRSHVMAKRTSEAAPGELPQILDLTEAKPLRERLAALAGDPSPAVDAGAVQRLSTPCAQVLLATGRAVASAGASFRIVNASAVFRAALADLGLQPEFSKWMD